MYFIFQEGGNNKSNGRLRGMILRSQLIVLLQNKVFNEIPSAWDNVSLTTFRKDYPRYSNIDVSQISQIFKL